MAHEIRVPRLGWSMEEGTFLGWCKQPGEQVAVGDPLFELEGEKAQQEIAAVDAGILHVPEGAPRPGSIVPVGSLLGYLLVRGEPVPGSPSANPSSETKQVIATNAASRTPARAGPAVRHLARQLGVGLTRLTGTGKAGRITRADVESAVRTAPSVASPRARRIANELGIDWTKLQGTGRSGRIREADVRSAAGRPAVTPVSAIRKTIADRLRISQARTIPVTLTASADATNLVGLRAQFKSAQVTIVPTYTDIVACLVARVLQRHRSLATRWQGDQELLQAGHDGIDIGIAVDTQRGLLVPVLRDVGRKSLADVATESKTLIDQARAGQLTAAQMQGGFFTITSLGAFGIDAFTPVINYPEVAILGLGAIRREPFVLPDDRIVARDRMVLSLTFDHVALDGACAAAFLRDVAATIETPAAHLLSRSEQ